MAITFQRFIVAFAGWLKYDAVKCDLNESALDHPDETPHILEYKKKSDLIPPRYPTCPATSTEFRLLSPVMLESSCDEYFRVVRLNTAPDRCEIQC